MGVESNILFIVCIVFVFFIIVTFFFPIIAFTMNCELGFLLVALFVPLVGEQESQKE